MRGSRVLPKRNRGSERRGGYGFIPGAGYAFDSGCRVRFRRKGREELPKPPAAVTATAVAPARAAAVAATAVAPARAAAAVTAARATAPFAAALAATDKLREHMLGLHLPPLPAAAHVHPDERRRDTRTQHLSLCVPSGLQRWR